MRRVCLYLDNGFGLGDVVMFCIVLKHLKKYRPQWIVGCFCQESHVSLLAPFCNLACLPSNSDRQHYDEFIRIDWSERFVLHSDRPSTKVAYALQRVFGIEQYDADLGKYEVPLPYDKQKSPVVTTHFAGLSYTEEKNLSAAQGKEIKKFIKQYGFAISDSCMTVADLISVIHQSTAFIGIDSGPGKIASATDTPTLICWTGHHPLQYHDPAPNTTHLIPRGWVTMPPFDKRGDAVLSAQATSYFTRNYRFTTYGPGKLVQEACAWLGEVLSGQNTHQARPPAQV